MRILVVSNTPFLPPAAGNRARIAAMLEHLTGAGHTIGLLLLPAVDVAEWDVEAMRARLAWVEVAAPLPEGPVGHLRERLRRLLARGVARPGEPLGIDDWCPSWFRAVVQDRVHRWTPDVVIVEYVFLSACLDGLASVHPFRTVIDTHDVMHRRRAVYGAVGLAPQWFDTTAAEERRGLLRADLVLAITEDDAVALGALVPERRILTVPHAPAIRPMPLDRTRPRRLLLVASYNDLHVEGFGWFVREVWPRLRAADPTVELVVCGTIAEKLGALPEGVVARGFVADLDGEYAAARVIVCPILAGTGLAVKAVDALCHGRPVVTTPVGATGLATGETAGVLVADGGEAFANAVLDLLDDPARWERAAEAARVQATRRFAPAIVFAPLLDALTNRDGTDRGQSSTPSRTET